ncbi:MAG: hypothetical protein HKN42_14455 [Granulosicoccus sp.]|nr:hypothetical protein [Granulosicoccus sp.]
MGPSRALLSAGHTSPTLSVALVSSVALLMLAGCARASDPELFRADPALQNDFTASLPTHGSTGGIKYEIIQGLAVFEGDILLGAVDESGTIPGKMRSRGLARSDAFGRWPDGIVPYLDPVDNSPTQQKNIREALEHWMERTRITFVERTPDNEEQYPHYLRFESSYSCASYVGMQGFEQAIMVSDACSAGSIIHEIGHALGLFHEHTRSDRDNYVQIDWEQIVDDKDINFDVQNANTQNLGPYDYGSIMHYGEYFFSKSGLPTIIVADGVEIGQRIELSETDAQSVDQMYATDLALLPPDTTTGATGLELGVTVLNQGNLGAHALELVVKLPGATQWQGISRDSGWQCASYGEELRCTRPTLAEQTESRFTLAVDPGTASSEDVMMLLSSRTLDGNTSNNHYNDDGSLTAAAGNGGARSNASEPAAAAANDSDAQAVAIMPAMASAQSGSGASDDAAGGGAGNGSLALLVLSLIGWRRRQALARH